MMTRTTSRGLPPMTGAGIGFVPTHPARRDRTTAQRVEPAMRRRIAFIWVYPPLPRNSFTNSPPFRDALRVLRQPERRGQARLPQERRDHAHRDPRHPPAHAAARRDRAAAARLPPLPGPPPLPLPRPSSHPP